MTRRRALLVLLAMGAAGTSRHGSSQVPARRFRIGLLPSIGEVRRQQFVEAMREVGWSEQREFALEGSEFKYGPEIEAAARQVVAQRPDLILCSTEAYAAAAQRLTQSIPIVMWVSGYPVESGVALSLARPGKNVTGSANYAGTGIWGKLLELLRDAKPGIKRIGVFWDYLPPAFQTELVPAVQRELRQDIARALDVTVHIVEVPEPGRALAAMSEIRAQRPDALLATAGPILGPVRQSVTQFAIDMRLPLISDAPWPQVEPQPLMSYSASPIALMRQAAHYIQLILRDGAKPADLPIQRPARFELVINLKTAKAIGLSLPELLLLRADQLIE